VNPMAQKSLLKYATVKTEAKVKNDSDSDDDGDFSKFGSKTASKKLKEAR
jgi:hypothetical protein